MTQAQPTRPAREVRRTPGRILPLRKTKMSWQFTVGLRVKRKADRIVVEAEDALLAALKVKVEWPEAMIMYVRRLNRRGDSRHPPHTVTAAR